MEFFKDIRCDVMVGGFGCDDCIKQIEGRVHSAAGARIDDQISMETVDEDLRGNGGVDLAHARIQRGDIRAVNRTFMDGQHGCFGYSFVFDMGQEGRKLPVARAEDADFHVCRLPFL